MSLDLVVRDLCQRLKEYNSVITGKVGDTTEKIGTCCGSRVLSMEHLKKPSREYTIPCGLQFYVDTLEPPNPLDQLKTKNWKLKYTAEEYLHKYEWHHKMVALPEIGCSYTIVIADTFRKEDEDDD